MSNKKLLQLLIGAMAGVITATANAGLVSDTNNTFGSVDGGSFNRLFTLPDIVGTINDVVISIDFSKCDDPNPGASATGCIGTDFSFNREIVFQLTSPSGTTVNLVNQDTYSGQTLGSRVSVAFDDDAVNTVGGTTLQSGLFRPVSPLSILNGLTEAGQWSLLIGDAVDFDPLQFYGAKLCVATGNDAVTECGLGGVNVPEPASLLLMSLGAMGIATTRRRKIA